MEELTKLIGHESACCGVYTTDCRSGGVKEEYVGLSDDPSNYSFSIHDRRINIEDKNNI